MSEEYVHEPGILCRIAFPPLLKFVTQPFHMIRLSQFPPALRLCPPEMHIGEFNAHKRRFLRGDVDEMTQGNGPSLGP